MYSAHAYNILGGIPPYTCFSMDIILYNSHIVILKMNICTFLLDEIIIIMITLIPFYRKSQHYITAAI